MGTPDFAVPSLRRLIQEGYDVCGVFTQPDKPQGRKMLLQAPPVKKVAQEAGISVWQPVKMKDGTARTILQELEPELIVVAAYGKILPKEILELPRYGCINVHGSLLPQYRGAAPIQWSVLNGETVTGVTTMQMDAGIDTGNMLMKAKTIIGENETAAELYQRLAEMGADLCVQTLQALHNGTLRQEVQQEEYATYAPLLSREMSEIDWQKSAQMIHNQIRGLQPWPIASTSLAGKRLKIYGSRKAGTMSGKPGSIVEENPLTVVCGDGGTLILTEIQADGGKRMKTEDYLRGHPIKIGTVLGKE